MGDGEIDGPPSRQVVVLSIDYLLKITEIVTKGADDDLVTAVIYLAVSRANLRLTFKDPGRARRLAGIADAPRDEDRQPVSVLAISRELALPYETTRRHVGKLVALGLCRRGPDGGLIIPLEVAVGEASAIGIEAIWRTTLKYICDLARLGVAVPARRRRIAPDIRRITSRTAAYYVLDLLNLARTTANLNVQTALLALAIVRANAQHLTREAANGEPAGAAGQPPSEDFRQPITTYALAREVNMPYETARRHVSWLEAAGLCERRGRGLIIPATAMARPELRTSVEANWRETLRFLEGLADLGLGAQEARRWLDRAG